ncbi:MAG: thiamine phosphate synthase [Novosphingobium sp.]|nr:thiamine phosphate synthase [Novosphingobium sp.]
MSVRHPPLPSIWLVTDARTDAALDRAIARLTRGSGVIFRHYHLPPTERAKRLIQVRRLCRRFGHRLEIGGEGYGPPAPHRRLATVHDLREIGRANRFKAEAVLLSPVHPTRSHPGGKCLGRLKFLLLSQRARMPVIALGGMTAHRFRGLPSHGWAAIDGLTLPPSPLRRQGSR